MGSEQPEARIAISVIHCRYRDSGHLDEPDPDKRPIEEIGVMFFPEDRPICGEAEHNILLGIVEVPGDADVTGVTQVVITQPHHVRRHYPGVLNDPTGLSGVKHFISARDILDVAANPACADLGITLVRDDRDRTG